MKRTTYIFLLTVFISLLITLSLNAAILNVPNDYETIQGAIDESEDGDTVLVQPGTYIECLSILGTELTLGSLYLTTGIRSYADSTIISGEESHTEGVIGITDTSNVVIAGISIINGYGFYFNFDMSRGSGMKIIDSEAKIENCVFRNNGTIWGMFYSDVIFCIQASVLLDKCAAYENTTISFITLFASDIIILNSTFASNEFDEGFFFNGFGDPTIIVNSIIWNCDSLDITKSDPRVYNSCIKGGTELDGENNIDTDPMFINPESYNLTLSENSPCIDAGTSFFVWGDDTLVNMTEAEYYCEAPDIGAYEFCFSDINNRFLHPVDYRLLTCFPNPFNSTTTISYSLPVASQVSLKVFDLSGREVKSLVDGYVEAGEHSVSLSGEGMASGVYLVRMTAGEREQARKVLLVR